MLPKREILSVNDMLKWKTSKGYIEYINFIKNLNDSVKGTNLEETSSLSENVVKVVKILDELIKWIDEIPPIQQPQRFGNKAFRDWFKRLQEKANDLLKDFSSNQNDLEEMSLYFIESFGNDTRIDYGTGHEMNFAFFLMCLYKIEILKQEDSKATVNIVFDHYLKLVRKLQLTYNMEPAGSHGVWSLDDFQFLPFIFGSSQLMDQAKIEPKFFVEDKYIEMYKNQFMFFGAIKYICQVKTGPFAEHSNQLWNISSVASWSKVNTGLIKMYIAEVLEKFPVVQHIKFGSYISISHA